MRKWISIAACVLLAHGGIACGIGHPAPGFADGDWRQRVAAAEAAALEPDRAPRGADQAVDGIGIDDGIVRVSLHLPTTQGLIAARLWLSAECLIKRDRRMIVLMPGTLANGAGYYELDVAGFEGFDAVGVLARAGYCALSVDLPGTGESDHPADAMDLRAVDNAAAVAEVAHPLSLLLGIRRWDVYAETASATPPALLLARRADVRSLVVTSPFYLRFGPASAPAFDPALRAFTAVSPYFPLDSALVEPFFGASPAPVQAAAVDAILGPAPRAIPTGAAFNEIAEVPFSVDPATGEFVLAFPVVDAGPARVDALLVQGSPDFVGSETGTGELAVRYGESGGGVAELLVIPGASHLMRFDTGSGDGAGSTVWAPVLDFLSGH